MHPPCCTVSSPTKLVWVDSLAWRTQLLTYNSTHLPPEVVLLSAVESCSQNHALSSCWPHVLPKKLKRCKDAAAAAVFCWPPFPRCLPFHFICTSFSSQTLMLWAIASFSLHTHACTHRHHLASIVAYFRAFLLKWMYCIHANLDAKRGFNITYQA